jgi:hypothetical protein
MTASVRAKEKRSGSAKVEMFKLPKWRNVGLTFECRLYRSNEVAFHARLEDIS